jgi:hypothetical protein
MAAGTQDLSRSQAGSADDVEVESHAAPPLARVSALSASLRFSPARLPLP